MASSSTDRRLGLTGATAFKAPVQLATTANITLSGEQSIDGVTTSSSDVLVKDQNTASQNGIYTSDTGSWKRRADFDGTHDAVEGTLVYVNQGSSNSGIVYRLTTQSPIIGSSNLTFTPGLFSGLGNVTFTQAGTGAISRGAQDKLRTVSVDIDDYVVNTTPGTTDCSAGLQAAINYVSGLGGGTVNCLRGPYKIATLSGATITFPASGVTMGYCIELKPNVKIRGALNQTTTFTGDWIYRTTAVNTSQKIMFRLTDAPTGASYFFENVAFHNSMIPIYGTGIISGFWNQIAYSGCAFPAILQQVERLVIKGCDIGGKTAGICIGGWLTGGTSDSGGWCDKSVFEDFSYITFDLLFTSTETAIDSFFNTNLFNNGGGGGGAVTFRGVVGISLFAVSRYDRGNFTNFCRNFFSFGSPRPSIFFGQDFNSTIMQVNAEDCGYEDYTYAGTGAHIMGGSGGGSYFQDPWGSGVGSAGKMVGLVQISTTSPSPNETTMIGMYLTGCAAINTLSGVANQVAINAISVANPDLTTPQSWANLRPTLTKTFAPNVYLGGTAIQNSGGGAYTTNTGIYSEDAGWIDYDLNIVLSSKGTAVGAMTIDLPVTAAANSNGSAEIGYYLNLFAGHSLTGLAVAGIINIYTTGSTSVVALTDADITNTFSIQLHIRYRKA